MRSLRRSEGPAAFLTQMQFLLGQFNDEFPERSALAASVEQSATAVRSSVSYARPLLQRRSEVQQALAKNEKLVTPLDTQLVEAEESSAKLKEQRAEVVSKQAQLKQRFAELATQVASLPELVESIELGATMGNFDKLFQDVDVNAIRESWSQLKPKCQSLRQPQVEPLPGSTLINCGVGGGGTGSDATQADSPMPQASPEDEEALRKFMSEWTASQEGGVSSEARKRASEFLEAAAKRSKCSSGPSSGGVPAPGSPCP